jgi:molecular chaperone GrpE
MEDDVKFEIINCSDDDKEKNAMEDVCPTSNGTDPCAEENQDKPLQEQEIFETENGITANLIPYFESLSSSMDKLGKYFEANVLYNKTQDKAIDHMHSELQLYRKDLYFQLLKPIIMELIELRESINRISKQYSLKPENEQAVPLHIFSSYLKDLEGILKGNSITVSSSNQGDSYDSMQHSIVETTNTSNPEDHHKINEIFSDCYRYNQKVLVKEKLSVFTYIENFESKKEGGVEK